MLLFKVRNLFTVSIKNKNIILSKSKSILQLITTYILIEI